MKKRFLFSMGFVISSILFFGYAQAESSARRVAILDRHDYYINQIASALFNMGQISMYSDITTPEWNRIHFLKKFDPHLIILHISCFLDPQKPNDQDFYQKLISFLVTMEPYRTKFLLYSSSPYYRKKKIIEAQVSQLEDGVPKLKGQNRIFFFQDPTEGNKDMDLGNKQTQMAFRRLVRSILR